MQKVGLLGVSWPPYPCRPDEWRFKCSAFSCLDMGNIGQCLTVLCWVLDWVYFEGDLPLRDLLQLRLAKIYLAQEKFEDAQAALKKVNAKQFKAIGQELEGDIFYAQGELDRARKSYQLAMDNADRIGSTEVLRIKMSNL